jgi:hypothetical protein
LTCLRREPEHISIRSDRRVDFPAPQGRQVFQGNLLFSGFPFAIWHGRPRDQE